MELAEAENFRCKNNAPESADAGPKDARAMMGINRAVLACLAQFRDAGFPAIVLDKLRVSPLFSGSLVFMVILTCLV